MQALVPLLFKKKSSKRRELVYTCSSEKDDISKLIKDSDAENTKDKENTPFLVCI